MKFKIISTALSDMIFPPKCASCGETIETKKISRALCGICYEKFTTESRLPCAVCGREYSLCLCKPKNFLPDGFAYSLPYNKADGITRKLILSCKNRKNRAVFEEITDRMVLTAQKRSIIEKETLVTYVPRAPEKELRFGIDQAEELARLFASKTGLVFMPLLRHRGFSLDQKYLGEERRETNADRNYYLILHSEELLSGKNIILIDDVVTSGATVNACTALLRETGAASVFCLSAAKNIKIYREYERDSRLVSDIPNH